MSRKIGNRAEALAAAYINKNGYKIIEQNYSTKFGEIDIIAIKDDVLVFVEVKFRQSGSHGRAYEYVTPRKIAKIKRAAWHFILNDTRIFPDNYRVDVVAIDGNDISLYENV